MINFKNRLEIISPEFSNKILLASDEILREIAVISSSFAIERTKLVNPILEESLTQLRAGIIGDQDLIDKLEDLVYELDLIQWEIRELWKENQAGEEDYVKAFYEARAANAVYYALQPISQLAAVESTYEAIAATDDLPTLEKLILNKLE